MRRTPGHILIILLLLSSNSWARIWYVKPDSTGQAINIQAGIDSCGSGDTVLVAPGVYRGDGNRDIDFKGKPILVISESRYNPSITDSTVIDCEGSYHNRHCGFYFHSGETNASILEGFTITNGRAIDGAGGGIACFSSSPAIRHNRLFANIAYGVGSGIFCDSSSACIADNIISGNSCEGCNGPGGGIACVSCFGISIIRNKITHNDVYSPPGGMYVQNSSAFIRDNDISRNYGGVCIDNSVVTMVGNNIERNGSWGPSALCCYNSIATIDSNRIHGHQSGGPSATPVFWLDHSRAVVRNNEISSNYGGGMLLCSTSGTIENNTIVDNPARPWLENPREMEADGFRAGYSDSPIQSAHGAMMEGCSEIDKLWASRYASYSQLGTNGHAIYIDAESHALLSGNIISNNQIGICSESDSVTVSCCDVYNNEGGNYVGLSDRTGINGNFSADPIFCNVASGEYTLHKQSPCLPGNHPNGEDCGLIGALEQGCDYVATLLQEQHAEIVASAIEVRWILADVGERMHFFVLRAKMPDGEYEEIPNASIGRESVSFTFKDIDCKPGAAYQYRVDVSDEAGRRILFETDPISMPALTLSLYQNYPNPFNPSTEIRYSLPEKCRVRLEVYDISGRRMASLVDGVQASGFHPVVWNGVDDRGSSVASGVYFCRLTAGKETISKKMVMLK